MPHSMELTPEEYTALRCKRCKKYTHDEHIANFIPIKEFSIQRLPPDMRYPKLVERIREMASQTVFIKVNSISKERPEMYRCGNSPSVGTGFIYQCARPTNQTPGYKPDKSFIICTALHVIYNTEEAKSARVQFFYDDDMDRSRVIRAKGVSVVNRILEGDWCQFMCEVQSEKDGEEVRQRIYQISQRQVLSSPMPSNVAYCVSHPHGLAQRVSVGRIKSVEESKIEEGLAPKSLLYIVCKCVIDTKITEKKVWYVCCRDKWIRMGFVNNFQSSYLDLVLSHLENKSLIEKPTVMENDIIFEKTTMLQQNIDREVMTSLLKKHGRNVLKMGEGDGEMKTREVTYEILRRLHTEVVFTDGFIERFKAIDMEIDIKRLEITTYNKVPKSIADVKSVHYSTPTCPGSSGARVVALLDNNQHMIGAHSRMGKGGNMSCRGTVSTD